MWIHHLPKSICRNHNVLIVTLQSQRSTSQRLSLSSPHIRNVAHNISMKPQHALQLSLQRRVIPVFLPNSAVLQLKVPQRPRHLQLAIHIKLERPRCGDARRFRRYRGDRSTRGGTQRRSEDRPEARSGLLLDYPSHTPHSLTGRDPPARLPNALLVVNGIVHHRQFGEAAVADKKGSTGSRALTTRTGYRRGSQQTARCRADSTACRCIR